MLHLPSDSLVELFEPTEACSYRLIIDQENKEYVIVADLNCDLLEPDKNNQNPIGRIYKLTGLHS